MAATAASQTEGVLYITLKEHLAHLEAIEQSKPEAQRRPVPSIVGLAEEIAVHPITLSNIANNHVYRLNLATGAAIIGALRRRGFPTEVKDLLVYRPGAHTDSDTRP